MACLSLPSQQRVVPALAQGLASLVLAWALPGVAIGRGLHDAAVATLMRLHGRGACAGWSALPGRLVGAAGPLARGWLPEHHGRAVLPRAAALGWPALLILLLLRVDNPGRS